MASCLAEDENPHPTLHGHGKRRLGSQLRDKSSIRGGAGLVARVTSSSRRRRRVEIGAAGRPGRRSDDEQGRPHGPPHARPGDAQPRLGQDRHDVHRGQQRVPRRRQGEGRVPPGRDLGPAGGDRRPLPRQGPAGRHRGPPPDPIVGRREGRPPLEDRDRRLARRDAVGPAQEGLRGAAGRRFARRPGRSRSARQRPRSRSPRRRSIPARPTRTTTRPSSTKPTEAEAAA